MPRTTEWPTVWHFHSTAKPHEPEGQGGDSDLPDRARWVLRLGIIALIISPVGIFAWMAGNACLKAIAEGRMDPTCESNARAGRLLGIVAVCMFAFKALVLFPLGMYWYYWIWLI